MSEGFRWHRHRERIVSLGISQRKDSVYSFRYLAEGFSTRATMAMYNGNVSYMTPEELVIMAAHQKITDLSEEVQIIVDNQRELVLTRHNGTQYSLCMLNQY